MYKLEIVCPICGKGLLLSLGTHVEIIEVDNVKEINSLNDHILHGIDGRIYRRIEKLDLCSVIIRD